VAVEHERVVVGATATLLADTARDRDGFTVVVQNPSDGASVYLGGPGVTSTSYGYEVVAGGDVGVDLLRNEALFAVVASGTKTVNVLRVGV
jgi:hypothetical protein